MNFIVAVDNNWGIGKDNDLLISIPDDMKRFREITMKKTVVMGRKTYESLPKRPLPNRKNIVISRNLKQNQLDEDVLIYNSIDKFVEDFQNDDNVFVIGGAEIYNQLMPFCKFAYITHIYSDFSADTFINKLDEHWALNESSETFHHAEISFSYSLYENTSLLK